MLYTDIAVNPKNYDNPVQKFSNSFFTNIGPTFSRFTNFYIDVIKIESSAGLFGNEDQEYTYAAID